MKQLHLKSILFVLLLCSNNTIAQTTHHTLLNNFNSSLWKVDNKPNGDQFAVGNSGSIFKKIHGCNSWQPMPVPTGTSQGLRDISFPSDQYGYISGTSGSLLRTTDGGQTWSNLNPNTNASLVSTFFINDSTGFISGGGTGGKIILKTVDFGSTWTDVTPQNLNSTPYELLFSQPDTGYALCTNGKILKSTDGGNNWTTIHPASSGISSLYAGCITNNGTIYGCGSSGTIVKSTDNGASWQTLNSGTTSFLWGIRFVNDSTGIALGASGKILLTTDYGSTWALQNTPYGSTVRDINWDSSTSGIIVGSSGQIFKFDFLQDIHYIMKEHFCSPIDSVSYNGWTNTGITNASEKWRFDNPNNNGVSYVMNSPFAIFDGQFYTNTIGNIDPDSSFIESPEFDATGFDTLSLSWHEAYLSNYLGEVYTKVEAFNGSNWVVVYESNGVEINNSYSAVYTQPTTNTLAPRTIDISEIAGTPNAKVRFTYYSTNNTALKFWWAIDDITISNQTTDIQLSNGTVYPGMNGNCTLTSNEDLKVKISNIGQTSVFPIELSYQVNNQLPVTAAFYDKLAPNHDTVYTIGSLNLNTPDVYTIKVWARKINDFNSQNDTVTFTLNSTSPLGLSLGNDTLMCPGDSILLQNNVLSPDDLLWFDNNQANTNYIHQPGSYSLKVSKQGCTEYDTIEISLKGNPQTVHTNTTDTSICSDESILIVALSDSTLWSNGTINDSILLTQGDTIWAIEKDNGCSSIDTTYIKVRQIQTPSKPSISNQNPLTFCEGDSVSLISSHSNSLWNNGESSNTITVFKNGWYSCVAVNEQCTSPPSDSIQVITLNRPAKPYVLKNGFKLSTNEIAENYSWYLNQTKIPNANLPYHTAIQNGFYTVVLTNNNGCSNVSEPVQILGTNIENFNNTFNIYPNPSRGAIHLKSDQIIEQVNLYHRNGNLLKSYFPNSTSLSISPDLSSGLYYLTIISNKSKSTYQLVIQ